MEYIYKIIECINENNLLSMGLFIFAIGFLIHLYTKKEEEENYIEFKLIGFY